MFHNVAEYVYSSVLNMKMECVCVPGGVVTCLPQQFQCGSQECLDPVLVCNSIRNCADGSDEGGSCNINCAEADNSRCSQSCYSTPQGTVRTESAPCARMLIKSKSVLPISGLEWKLKDVNAVQ